MYAVVDRGKTITDRADRVLFIDARPFYRQIDRAHRDFTQQQIEFLSNIVRMYRREEPQNNYGSGELMSNYFSSHKYADVPGLCKVATSVEIEAQGWSLNPGRYVGVAVGHEEDFDFSEQLSGLNEDFAMLHDEARELEARIAANVAIILEAV